MYSVQTMSSLDSNYNQNTASVNMTNFPSSAHGGTVETRRKLIEIKTERLKALRALAKSQSILTEIEIAIAQFELKQEMNKMRKLKYRRVMRRRRTKSRRSSGPVFSPLASKNQSPGYEPVKSPTQNSEHKSHMEHSLPQNEDIIVKDTLPEPPLNGVNNCSNESSKYESNSIMCSIPLNKIMELQNVSAAAKCIFSTYLSQKNDNYHCNNDQYTHTTDLSHPYKGSAPVTDLPSDIFKSKQNICINMLRVTHRYNISIIPTSIDNNQPFSHTDGDGGNQSEQLHYE